MLGQPATDGGLRFPAGSPPAAVPAVLQMRGVSRIHGGRAVWAPLDVSLAAGTLTVVTGPNGSGKSTLLRLASGLLRPSSGSRECAGRALYVRGGGGLRGAQTVADAVTSTAGLAGRRGAVADAVDLLGIGALAHRRVGTLSAGERVRAAMAAAVACRPALLCLDEPTAALDPQGTQDLAGVLDALRADSRTILVATHQPGVLLTVADAHLEIGDGRVVLR
ncbi:ABC-2 type transport system ATP-binding protein/putative ABC transport system ATP-binding protein/heme exporter protein A [Blastococcus colisei]|uniref:ABC-2 type transport system ATP-binding protein/putative ABC transport system ATP-binding protein/heme exporter protein A n=1 Tax=Blastococcus colisei TaxID=1564162 RepID=A0A543PEQ5_9ACTN|nr:ATP-binding cassette domain-containing protein [Blastococcus colisei]TQN42543.1 ABC-2 type transport system ATP-binding protein/putative ABC transport system ATP-binding protein/heme exporter protein A [Blastococcus colisei]